MKPINKSLFLYLVTISNIPENYVPIDCLQSAVVSAPSPGMALLVMQNYDMSDNNDISNFWQLHGKVEKIGIVPNDISQESKMILQFWR